jgi:signal transduction histidine kinase
VRTTSPSRVDAAVAALFVLAAALEALLVHRDTLGVLLLGLGGAPVLAVLAVRRSRPVLCLVVLTAFAVAGTVTQLVVWPRADDSGGVWIFAMLLACYSLGRHAQGPALLLGFLLPLTVVLVADVPTMTDWQLAGGVLFVTLFVGALPTLVGRLVQLRHGRLELLAEQRALILAEQQARRDAAVRAERLQATERLRPLLVDGLRELSTQAEQGADPAALELRARDLLGRTREEVVALTAPGAPASPSASPDPSPTVDHDRLLRAASQRWVVLGAGVVAVGLALETSYAARPDVSDWLVLAGSTCVGVPLAVLPWRPLPALVALWAAVVAFAHLVSPLSGTLSEPAVALSASFAIAVLASARRWAIVGLGVCLAGQALAIGTNDLVGAALLMALSWTGGLAVHEASRLVEQSRSNNALLADQERALAERAVIDERFRLARDVHDQIGHSLTVVALQAGAARRLARNDPTRARALLGTIAAAAREGVEAVDAVDGTAFSALLEHTRAAGLPVQADVADLETLAPEQRVVALRVVQEALTNVLRHAPGAEATVRVRRADRELEVLVTNSRSSGPGAGSGSRRGLPGLSERVEAAGGRLSWEHRPDGGFVVAARLPGALAETGR